MVGPDRGPHRNSWPDGGMTPFRSEKNTNWEGAFRIPLVGRWPGKIKAGSISNEIIQHHDWFPTFLAMAGDAREVKKLPPHHLQEPHRCFDLSLSDGKEQPAQALLLHQRRREHSRRAHDNWKMVFMEQRCQGTLQVWAEPFTRLRVPKLFNLRTDPYEFADVTSNSYYDWFLYHGYILPAAQAAAAQFAATFKELTLAGYRGLQTKLRTADSTSS